MSPSLYPRLCSCSESHVWHKSSEQYEGHTHTQKSFNQHAPQPVNSNDSMAVSIMRTAGFERLSMSRFAWPVDLSFWNDDNDYLIKPTRYAISKLATLLRSKCASRFRIWVAGFNYGLGFRLSGQCKDSPYKKIEHSNCSEDCTLRAVLTLPLL